MAAVPKQTSMAIKSYKNQAQMLVKNYLLADPFAPYTSILGGILAFKVVYDLADLINNFYIKTYPSLTKIQRVDWNNRYFQLLDLCIRLLPWRRQLDFSQGYIY
ncbi:hypothetical protein V6Z11_D10G143500 [Gossypium hirsutum]